MTGQTDADPPLGALHLGVSGGAGLEGVGLLPGDRVGPAQLDGDQAAAPHLELEPGPAEDEGHRLLVSGSRHREAAYLEQLVTWL